MCGLRIRVKNSNFFQENFRKNVDFYWEFSPKNLISRAKISDAFFKVINSKISVYPDKMIKFDSYNWAYYSISLQNSPLSNIIKYKNNISRPSATPSAHNLRVSTPNSPGLSPVTVVIC